MKEEHRIINKELRREGSWHQEVKVVLGVARGTELDRVIIIVLVYKELRGEESWHQGVKVVLRGSRGRVLDRVGGGGVVRRGGGGGGGGRGGGRGGGGGSRGRVLDRDNIIKERAKNNVLVLKKESVMVMVNPKYKEDLFNVK